MAKPGRFRGGGRRRHHAGAASGGGGARRGGGPGTVEARQAGWGTRRSPGQYGERYAACRQCWRVVRGSSWDLCRRVRVARRRNAWLGCRGANDLLRGVAPVRLVRVQGGRSSFLFLVLS